MTDEKRKRGARRERLNRGDVASFGLIVAAVLLGWQVIIQPVVQRGPVAIAVRVAPTSPTALSRAAEAELAAGRVPNAAELSQEALSRAPFDVRALRTFGLTEARSGREQEADDILTLAGNWSLREDPAHAWLVERRLRRGSYASSFAHADALLRRRVDLQPGIFRLFTAAGTEDPQRALPVIVELLSAKPAWRDAYLASLQSTPQELQLAAAYAVLLEAGPAPMSADELQHLYRNLLQRGQYPAMSQIRRRLNRPRLTATVTNGDFTDPDAPEPFQWRLAQKAGIVSDIVEDDFRAGNQAMRIEYDGYTTGIIVEQFMLLGPGTYDLAFDVRTELADPGVHVVWTISCASGGQITSIPVRAAAAGGRWRRVSGQFNVTTACPAQWLRVEGWPGDRRSQTVLWFDDLAISPKLGQH